MKKKKLVTMLLSLVGMMVLCAFSLDEQSITGTWKATEMEQSTIKIYKAKDGYFYGKIIASNKKEWIDKIVLKKVKYHPKDEKWKGQIYSLRRNMSIDVVLRLENTNKLKLVGTKLFMTKTFYWTR